MPWRVIQRGARFCVVKIDDGETVACHATRTEADAQRRALYASTDYGLRLALQDFDLTHGTEFTRESDVNLPGGGHNLRDHWVRGPGAVKIRWGTDGSFARCVRQLGKYVRDPRGLCAEYHKAATGEWPAEKGVESSMDGMVEAHGTAHNEKDHNPHKGFRVPGSTGIDEDTVAEAVRNLGKYGRSALERNDRNKLGELEAKVARGENLTDGERFELRLLRKLYGDSRGDERNYALAASEGVESSMGEMVEAHGTTHNEQDHNPHKGGGSLKKLSKAEKKKLDIYEQKLFNDVDLQPGEKAEYRELLRRDRGFSVETFAAENDDCGPEQHKMSDGSCMDDDSPKMDSYALGDSDEPWEGVLSVEGVESGDGRLFALGSLDWERPPQPLMYQPANVGGHNASVLVGNITKITRHGSRIRGEGIVFGSALGGEHGDGIRHMMETGGVSVDVDRVKDADVEMVYADDETGDGAGNVFAKPETTIFHRGRIRGATLVAFPAFVEAKLTFTGETLTASVDPESCGCESDDPLVAASHTITIPNLPPAEWFDEPTDVKLSGALTITDEGRVYAIVAPADTNHRNFKNVKVPRNLDFSRFHKGETIVEGGGRVVTGVITAGCGHAATENYGTLNRRLEHYDNSCSVLANIRTGYGRGGHIWAAGALNPGADPRQVAQALGCALSLDVQPHPDRPGIREFIAAHLVPVPGFPLARTQASVVYQDGVLAASSIPVVHVAEPTYVESTFNIYHVAKRALAASIGMDYSTRKAALAAELELI